MQRGFLKFEASRQSTSQHSMSLSSHLRYLPRYLSLTKRNPVASAFTVQQHLCCLRRRSRCEVGWAATMAHGCISQYLWMSKISSIFIRRCFQPLCAFIYLLGVSRSELEVPSYPMRQYHHRVLYPPTYRSALRSEALYLQRPHMTPARRQKMTPLVPMALCNPSGRL